MKFNCVYDVLSVKILTHIYFIETKPASKVIQDSRFMEVSQLGHVINTCWWCFCVFWVYTGNVCNYLRFQVNANVSTLIMCLLFLASFELHKNIKGISILCSWVIYFALSFFLFLFYFLHHPSDPNYI